MSKSDSILISFVGRPDGVFFQDDGQNEFPTNTLTLKQSLESLRVIANLHSNKQFVFVYKPHPNDDSPVDPNSLISGLPDNVQIVSKSQKEWKEFLPNASEIAAASDLLLTIRSTVGQTLSLLGAHENEENFIPLALHILLKEFQPYIENSAFPDKLGVLKMKAAPFVENKDELTEIIERCLFDKDFQTEFRRNQKGQFWKNFYHGQAAERLWFWTMTYHNYQEGIKEFLLSYQNQSK